MNKIFKAVGLMGLIAMITLSFTGESQARVMKCARGYTLSGSGGYYLCSAQIGGSVHQYDNQGNQWTVYGAQL